MMRRLTDWIARKLGYYRPSSGLYIGLIGSSDPALANLEYTDIKFTSEIPDFTYNSYEEVK